MFNVIEGHMLSHNTGGVTHRSEYDEPLQENYTYTHKSQHRKNTNMKDNLPFIADLGHEQSMMIHTDEMLQLSWNQSQFFIFFAATKQ